MRNFMFKMIVILRKKPGMTTEQFRSHWKNTHGPLFKAFPQIKVYTQFHVTDKCRDNTDIPIDGIAILEFTSAKEKDDAWKMLAYDKIREDEQNFLKFDGAGIHVVYVDEEIKII